MERGVTAILDRAEKAVGTDGAEAAGCPAGARRPARTSAGLNSSAFCSGSPWSLAASVSLVDRSPRTWGGGYGSGYSPPQGGYIPPRAAATAPATARLPPGPITGAAAEAESAETSPPRASAGSSATSLAKKSERATTGRVTMRVPGYGPNPDTAGSESRRRTGAMGRRRRLGTSWQLRRRWIERRLGRLRRRWMIREAAAETPGRRGRRRGLLRSPAIHRPQFSAAEMTGNQTRVQGFRPPERSRRDRTAA